MSDDQYFDKFGSILIIQTRGCNLLYQFITGEFTRDVEFRTEALLKFIRIHAAFARVLYLSGAGDHFDKVEDAIEEL